VRFKRELSPEPLLQSDNADIRAQAAKIVGAEKDPRKAAALLTSWVHDKMAKEYIVGVPDAAQILKTMRGDCNEHTQLFLALSRAAGVPARAAAGLAYVDGRFFYHAWPEVWLGQWVAVDPTFGQFPADAAHLRFTIGGLARQAMLVRLIGTIGVDVVSATPLR
jgi:transglutaminase-like putative cysteine protease